MINLGFNGNLNASISIGDSVYYIETQTVGSNTDNSTEFTFGTIPEPTTANPVAIGIIDSILTNDINSIFYTASTLEVIVEDSDGVDVATIVNTIINVQESGALLTPPANSFLFFSKDNKYNMSSLTGYFGEVQFRNNSTTKAELYAVACEVVQSSK